MPVDECELDIGEPLLVVTREVEAEVVVVEGRELEVREPLGVFDRRLDAERILEVVRPPADREQQAVRAPRVGPLERPQRRLEHAHVVDGWLAHEVEEEQAVEAWRDRIAMSVLRKRRDPCELARRQAGRLRAEWQLLLLGQRRQDWARRTAAGNHAGSGREEPTTGMRCAHGHDATVLPVGLRRVASMAQASTMKSRPELGSVADPVASPPKPWQTQ